MVREDVDELAELERVSLAHGHVAMLLAHDWMPRSVAEAWLIVVLSAAAAVTLGNMAGARSAAGASVGMILSGLFLGPIFPTLVGILFRFGPHFSFF